MRPGLKAALADCRATGAPLIVDALDRLSRDLIETLVIHSDELGGALVSLSEDIDTSTANGWLSFVMRATMSEFERRLIMDRCKKARTIQRANAQFHGGAVPYGWRLVGKTDLVRDDDEQEVVALVVGCRVDGHTWESCAKLLNQLGLRRRCGGEWTPPLVNRTISRASARLEAEGKRG